MRRLLRGIGSTLRKLGKIDANVVRYIALGPRPPRIIYVTMAVGITGLIIGVIRNPGAGILLVILASIVSLALLYVLANVPPLRWHILSDTVRMVFEDPSSNIAIVTDSLRMRAMRKHCNSLRYPITYSGQLSILEVLQDGEPLPEKSGKDDSMPGYLRQDGGLLIELRRAVRFGGETAVVLRYKFMTAVPIDEYTFSANTFVDRFALTVCFHRLKYPRRIEAFSEFGIGVEQFDFIPERRAEDAEHVCETWEPPSMTYLHRYVLRWAW